MKDALNLVWLDLEMTGLDPAKHRIIEIATVVTDPGLNVLAEGPSLAIHQPEHELAKMDDWCTTTHGESGLTQRVRESRISCAEAEAQTLRFLSTWVDAGQSPLCGNSVAQDRRFLRRYMPALDAFFHYRLLDVSTVKELARRWAPQTLAGVAKQGRHLALDDIRDSISELAYYRSQLFRSDLA